MYNTKVKVFQNGTVQCTFYTEPIKTSADRWKRPKLTESLDRPQYDDADWCENPFENNEYQYIPKFDLLKRAAELTEEEKRRQELEDEQKHEKSMRTSMNRSKKKIIDYGRSNVWHWFFTFTFKESDCFSREDYDACRKKVCEWFKNVRKRLCKNIKYLIIPEQHEDGKCWHFHALVANCDELTFKKAINNQEFRKHTKGKLKGQLLLDKKGQPIPNKYYRTFLRVRYPYGDFVYNISNFESGFTTATQVRDTRKAVSYIIKYVTKDLSEITFGKRRYLPSNNLDLPETYKAIIPRQYLNDMLCKIEYTFKVKLSIEAIKSYVVNVENYYNHITVFEFNPTKIGGDSNGKYSLYPRRNQSFDAEKEEDIRSVFAYI